MTQFYFERMYEGRVQVEYHDLADPEEAATYQELLAQAQELAIPFPLVALNGEVRLAGGAEFYQIKPLVDEVLKASSPAAGSN